MNNKRLSREYGIRFDDSEVINIGEAKEKLESKKKKIAEFESLMMDCNLKDRRYNIWKRNMK